MEKENNNTMQSVEFIQSGNGYSDTNKGLVEYTDFQRVNFDEPITVIHYGNDLLNQMGNLMKDISNMMRREEVDLNALASIISKIEMFSENLDNLDEKKAKELEESNSVLKKLAKFVKKSLGKSEEMETYSDQYDDYSQDLDKIASYLETQKNDTLTDINMYSIRVGESDLENYKKIIEAKRQEAIVNPEQNIMNEITLGSQKMELFSRKLDELRKNLVLSKNTVVECKTKQSADMELVLLYDSYINSTVPTMKIQATSIIGVKRQREAVNRHQQLVDVTNNALKKNSQMLIGNIQEITELSINGNIRVETLKELQDNVKKGIELLKQGNTQRIQKRENDKVLLNELSKSLEASSNETISLWSQENVVFSEGFETHNYPSVKELEANKPKRFRKLPRIGSDK